MMDELVSWLKRIFHLTNIWCLPEDDVQSKISEVLQNVVKCSIRSVTVGHSPLHRSRSVTIFETDEGQWKCQERFEEEGIIVYVAIKYKTDREQNQDEEVKYLFLLTTNVISYLTNFILRTTRMKVIIPKTMKMILKEVLYWISKMIWRHIKNI